MENDIFLSPDYVFTFEIHSKKFFRRIYESITSCNSLDDENEPFVLLDIASQKEISAENIISISDINKFDMNNKIVLSAINERISKYINTDNDIASRLRNASIELRSLIVDISDEFECNFNISEKELDMSKVLKLYGFSADCTDCDWLDRLLSIVTLYADLFPDKILCFFNIKEWLSLDETKIFYNHIINQKIRVLLVEGVENNKYFKFEKKLIIDENYDEILINYHS